MSSCQFFDVLGMVIGTGSLDRNGTVERDVIIKYQIGTEK
jgi:hypothetical protein